MKLGGEALAAMALVLNAITPSSGNKNFLIDIPPKQINSIVMKNKRQPNEPLKL